MRTPGQRSHTSAKRLEEQTPKTLPTASTTSEITFSALRGPTSTLGASNSGPSAQRHADPPDCAPDGKRLTGSACDTARQVDAAYEEERNEELRRRGP